MTDDRPERLAGPAPGPGRAAPPPALSTAEIAAITGGEVLRPSDRAVRGGAVDSRLVSDGELFVALPGERTDGHRFLAQAIAAGAAAVLVARRESLDGVPSAGPSGASAGAVLVDDPLRGLQAVAAAWRDRFDPLVVGITGSIAKTSTKEAIATVLAADRATLRSEGNQNNEIGLPLTLLRLGPEHAACVLEMGMYVGGEIRDLARMGRPSIGVVTAVQGVHLSRIGSLDAIEAAKGELVEALPADGVAVLNADDPRVARMATRTRARALTYGFAEDADVRAENVTSAGLDGMTFELVTDLVDGGRSRRRVAIPTLGRLSVHNALAAAAVGLAAEIDVDRIAEALGGGWSAPHRGVIVRAGDLTLVDDSYNASPGSVTAALDLLAGLPGRHLAVLGEMLELGESADEGHAAVGRAAAGVVAGLIVVGAGAAGIARGARAAGLPADRIIEVPDRAAAAAAVRRLAAPGDVVLVKASRGVELDRLVDELARRPGPDA